MVCPKCGKKLRDDAKFCSGCGHGLENDLGKGKDGKRGGAKTPKIWRAVAVCCVAVLALAYFALLRHPASEWLYVVEDGRAYITGYHGKESEAVIPEKVKQGWFSYAVAGVCLRGFATDGSLTSIEIPGSIKEMSHPWNGYGIRNWLFRSFGFDKESVTNVVLQDGVEEIGQWAFGGNSLTSIKIPGSVKVIDEQAFENCSSLTSIKIPGSVKVIGRAAFRGCSSLTNVEILDGVKVIGEGAFGGCSSLTSIKIPGSVVGMEGGAFGGSSLTNVEILDGVKVINESAFRGCSSLTSIKIPGSVVEIEEGAFQGCSSLTSIEIPSSVEIIGVMSFPSGCDVIRR